MKNKWCYTMINKELKNETRGLLEPFFYLPIEEGDSKEVFK